TTNKPPNSNHNKGGVMTMAKCPNLREIYGDRYRIGHDAVATTPSERKNPWMMTIPCRGGVVIYPHGDDVLAVEVDYGPQVAKRLAAIPGAGSVTPHLPGEPAGSYSGRPNTSF